MLLMSTILVVIVAVEALLICCLEIFGSQTAAAQRAFGFSAEYQHRPETKSTMANIGLYNGFVGIGLLFMRFGLPANAAVAGCLLFTGFVFIAGIFGGLTVRRQIVWTQGLPGLLALLSLLVFN